MEISFVLGVLIGALLGLTGAGGGILAVPALIAGMGWSLQQAAPVAMIAVAGSAAIGAIDGFRRRLVRYRAAVLMAIAGVPLTFLGQQAGVLLPQRWLIGGFAVVMFLVALRLLLQSRQEHAEENSLIQSPVGQLNPATGRFLWNWPTASMLTAVGALTGFLIGLLGVGGGFVMVPLLRKFTRVSMHGVVATSLMVTALVGSMSVLLALLRGVQLPMAESGIFVLAVATGMLIGRRLVPQLPARLVQDGFAVILLLVAIGMLVKAVFFA